MQYGLPDLFFDAVLFM